MYEISARFLDSSLIDWARLHDHEKDGVFKADPSLRAFVVSGPGVAAALRTGFERKRNARINIIEQYAARGGDDGLTDQINDMREACGVPPRTH